MLSRPCPSRYRAMRRRGEVSKAGEHVDERLEMPVYMPGYRAQVEDVVIGRAVDGSAERAIGGGRLRPPQRNTDNKKKMLRMRKTRRNTSGRV